MADPYEEAQKKHAERLEKELRDVVGDEQADFLMWEEGI